MKIETLIPRKTPLVIAAAYFAYGAHGSIGQKRKYTDEPYIVHPLHVAKLLIELAEYVPSDEQIAAAILHDTIEDTPVTSEVIHRVFGNTVGELVDWLTDVSKPSDGNRKKRKQIDLEHTAKAPKDAKDIKLCDVISNAPSIVDHDPDFAQVWLREKHNLLQVLTDTDPTIYAKAVCVYTDSMQKIGKS